MLLINIVGCLYDISMLLRVVALAFLVSLAVSGSEAVYAVGECVVKAVGNSTSVIKGTVRFTQV
jgi:hypothetical protein